MRDRGELPVAKSVRAYLTVSYVHFGLWKPRLQALPNLGSDGSALGSDLRSYAEWSNHCTVVIADQDSRPDISWEDGLEHRARGSSSTCRNADYSSRGRKRVQTIGDGVIEWIKPTPPIAERTIVIQHDPTSAGTRYTLKDPGISAAKDAFDLGGNTDLPLYRGFASGWSRYAGTQPEQFSAKLRNTWPAWVDTDQFASHSRHSQGHH